MNVNTLKILDLILEKNIKPSDISKIYKEYKYFNHKSLNDISSVLPNRKLSLEDIRFKKKLKNQIIESLNTREFCVVNIAQKIYPYLLKEIFFSPPLLFCKGIIEILNSRLCIAVVGTRRCSKYGADVTRFLCTELSRLGFTIVSGMAVGIDRIAHLTTLNEGGKSIGVLGTGIDLIYPPENADLFKDMIKGGCLITEFFPSVKPLKQNFPARNRIISGICIGAIIVEAGEKSGAVITAKTALKENREVFAVPGNIFSDKNCGCHRLIQNGAKLVNDIDDILVELENYIKEYGNNDDMFKSTREKDEKKEERRKTSEMPVPSEMKSYFSEVLKSIGYTEKSLEDIQKETKIDKNKLLQIISFLQLNDYILEKSFNNYVLNK